METSTSKGKEIRIPGPDHPIKISPAEGRVRVTAAGRAVAESTRALRLEEKGYPPVYPVWRPTGQNAKASHRTWIHRGFSRERIDQSALQVSCGELLSLVDRE